MAPYLYHAKAFATLRHLPRLLHAPAVMDDIASAVEGLGLVVEQLHTEAATGQFEIVTQYDSALKVHTERLNDTIIYHITIQYESSGCVLLCQSAPGACILLCLRRQRMICS